MVPSARGIVIHNNKVLLIYREKNGQVYYSIPGGKTEENETLEQTVLREVLEETCIEVTVDKLIGEYKGSEKDKIQYIYLCNYVKGEPKLGDSVEREAMAKDPTNYYNPLWVDINEALELTIKPSYAESAFKDVLRAHIEQ